MKYIPCKMVLSEEEFSILEKAYDILTAIVSETENATESRIMLISQNADNAASYLFDLMEDIDEDE